MTDHYPHRRKHTDEAGLDSWLMSYADMITLLLCFFIIFISTSEPKEDKLAAATSGLKGMFGSVDLSTPFTGSMRTLEGIVSANQAYQSVSIEKTSGGIQMELAAGTYFTKDAAELNPARIEMLKEMLNALKSEAFKGYYITIEGHTDDVAPASGLYATNWELAAARATRLVRFFMEQEFDPALLRAEVYGQARPVVPNKDATGEPIPQNRERNSRVVIKVERRG